MVTTVCTETFSIADHKTVVLDLLFVSFKLLNINTTFKEMVMYTVPRIVIAFYAFASFFLSASMALVLSVTLNDSLFFIVGCYVVCAYSFIVGSYLVYVLLTWGKNQWL